MHSDSMQPTPTRYCPRCHYQSLVRSYDGVMCLLCGHEVVEQSDPLGTLEEHLEEMIKNNQGYLKRGPKARKHDRTTKVENIKRRKSGLST